MPNTDYLTDKICLSCDINILHPNENMLLILPWKAIFPTSFICIRLKARDSAEEVPAVFLGRVTLTSNPQNVLHSCCQRVKKKVPASDKKKSYIKIHMRVSIRC